MTKYEDLMSESLYQEFMTFLNSECRTLIFNDVVCYRNGDVCRWLGYKAPLDALMRRSGRGNVYKKPSPTSPFYIDLDMCVSLYSSSKKRSAAPIEDEVWKDVECYEGIYQVSNHGRVYSMRQDRVMRLGISGSGYHQVHLYSEDRERECVFVHKMVARLFVENPDPVVNNVIDHVDCNKRNNHFSNLEWCTYTKNLERARNNGLIKSSKLTWDDVNDIRNSAMTTRQVMEKYKISYHCARSVMTNKTWKEGTQ